MWPLISNFKIRVDSVANETERYALTASQAPVGYYVAQEDNDHLYLVLDTAYLNSARGYLNLGLFPQVPINTALPSISGSAAVGLVLTAGNGTWLGSPASYAYQWYRCDPAGNNPVAISGATSQTYTIQSGDAGNTLRVDVLASNAYGPALAAAQSAQSVVVSTSTLPAGVLAYYKLEDAGDSSGNGNNLTNNNSVTFVTGKVGNAASFNGSNCLSLAADLIEGQPAVTIAGWFNVNSWNGGDNYVLGQSTGDNSGMSIELIGWNSGEVAGVYTMNGGDHNAIFTSSGAISTGTWYFFAIRFDGTTFDFGINGSSLGTITTSGPLNNPSAPVQLGADRNTGGSLDGLLDEIGIWNRSLTDGEITELYNGGTGTTLF